MQQYYRQLDQTNSGLLSVTTRSSMVAFSCVLRKMRNTENGLPPPKMHVHALCQSLLRSKYSLVLPSQAKRYTSCMLQAPGSWLPCPASCPLPPPFRLPPQRAIQHCCIVPRAGPVSLRKRRSTLRSVSAFRVEVSKTVRKSRMPLELQLWLWLWLQPWLWL